jgi:hypothetical protein
MVYPLLKETIKKFYLALASVYKVSAWRKLKTAKIMLHPNNATKIYVALCGCHKIPQRFMLHYVDATNYHKNQCGTMWMPQNIMWHYVDSTKYHIRNRLCHILLPTLPVLTACHKTPHNYLKKNR